LDDCCQKDATHYVYRICERSRQPCRLESFVHQQGRSNVGVGSARCPVPSAQCPVIDRRTCLLLFLFSVGLSNCGVQPFAQTAIVKGLLGDLLHSRKSLAVHILITFSYSSLWPLLLQMSKREARQQRKRQNNMALSLHKISRWTCQSLFLKMAADLPLSSTCKSSRHLCCADLKY
jgi:hypothetical protein